MKLLLTLLATLLLNTGCLSSALTGKITAQEEAGREWQDVTLNGRKGEVSTHAGKSYQIYEFCGFKDDNSRILEVWIPLSDGPILLKEHRKHFLRGNLPYELKCVFGVETNFKGRFFNPVNFNGEPIKIERTETKEQKPEDNLRPEIFRLENRHGRETFNSEVIADQLRNDVRIKLKRINPYHSTEEKKWLLLTTRLNQSLSLTGRTGTRYTLITSDRNYDVNPDEIDYEYRSWLGNKLMKASYIVTVPVDIVITPVIALGVVCIGAFSSIF